jgi:hypothetical protein
MAFVRFVMGGLIALGVLVVAMPAVVLVDLASGGTGLGLCPSGLGTCTTSMYTIAELVVILLVALAVISTGIALCARFLRRRGRGSVGVG